MNVWEWQKNPHASSCAFVKQHSGTRWAPATHTSQLKCLSLVRHGISRWSTLTCTMLCGMSGAAVGTVSLIYQDKCKHVKSRAHTARWLGRAYHEPSLVGTSPAYTVLLSICHGVSWIKAQNSPYVHLTLKGCNIAWMSGANRSRCGCQETSGQMSQHRCWQPSLSAC